nr:MAG TPA: hypothetical protein [Caudoviricetes sp.]DAS24828.1 MAG TPA: hypothetical protein [Caudoviricetes sp.]
MQKKAVWKGIACTLQKYLHQKQYDRYIQPATDKI